MLPSGSHSCPVFPPPHPTENFFWVCEIPMTFTELGIDASQFEVMAEDAVNFGGLGSAYVPLDKEDVVAILNESL